MKHRYWSIGTALVCGLWLNLAQAQVNESDFDEQPEEATSGASGSSAAVTAPKTSVSSDDVKAITDARKAKSEEALIRSVSRVLSIDPTHLIALNSLGVFYFEQGKLGLARMIFNRALTTHTDVPALHNNLGIIYLAEDKQRQAIASFRKSLEIKSDYRIGAANLGSIFLEYKDYERAIGPLEAGYKAVKGDIRSGNAIAIEVANNYALALMGTGQTSDAKRIFEDLAEDNSRNVHVLLNYASLLIERMKDMSAGAKVLNRLKFVADDSKTIRRVEELEAMLRTK